jgi:ABC-type transporter Mla MlaB component
MIRVTQTETGSQTTVTIDGQLEGDSVNAVETFCNEITAKGRRLRVYLRDVSVIDRAGCVLLRRLAAKGVCLLADGLYTSSLVRALRSASEETPVPKR